MSYTGSEMTPQVFISFPISKKLAPAETEECEKLPRKNACSVQDCVCSKLSRKLIFLGVHRHTEPNFLDPYVLGRGKTLGQCTDTQL